MAKSSSDLRDRLFDAIDAVKNGSMTVEQARAVGDLAQVIVNTAKVEIDYLHRAGGPGAASKFLDVVEPGGGTDDGDAETAGKPNGIVGVRRHLLKG